MRQVQTWSTYSKIRATNTQLTVQQTDESNSKRMSVVSSACPTWIWALINWAKSLDANTFVGLSKLQTLYLASNALSSLNVSVFRGLSSLYSISLHGRQSIKQVWMQLYSTRLLTSLQTLAICSNTLSLLDATLFYRLRVSLVNLQLSTNQLTYMDETVFGRSTRQIEVFNFECE